MYNRSQCEELRGLQFKKNQDEVCRERANQLVLKQEEKQRKKEGKQPHDHLARAAKHDREQGLIIAIWLF